MRHNTGFARTIVNPMSSLRDTASTSDLTPAPATLDAADEADRERRFGGIARLYGRPALVAFERSHVAVIGIGGVGSWVAEALARSAVGGDATHRLRRTSP